MSPAALELAALASAALAPRVLVFAALAALTLTACRQDMHDQPRYEPLEANPFFADQRASRPQVAGTVARGQLHEDEQLYLGTVNGEPAETFPFAVTREVIERGRQRFEIFCTPCHGRLGNGQGMVTQRGFRHPPTYHSQQLREAPVGHFFDVISNGFGAMYSFNDRIPPQDRWAIVAYIRTLQFSQAARAAELPPAMRQEFEQAVSP
jgi:mono/diheme cytochrome c family protein